mgnify:FL=1
MLLDQFSRTRLLLGDDGVEALHGSRVCVFGVGGVGGYVVEALARCGVGAIDVVDDDKVCITNINRQVIATWDTVGRYKVDVMAERVASINPGCTVAKHCCFYLPQTRSEFDFAAYDYVVDAVDTVTAKLDIIVAANEVGTPVISCMGAGNKLDPTKLEVADIYDTSVCRLARVMRRELRRRNIPSLKCVYSREPSIEVPDGAAACKKGCVCPPGSSRTCLDRRAVPGSVSFVPSVAGLIIASEVVRDLIASAAKADE